MDERIASAIRNRIQEGGFRCADAFRIVDEKGVTPLTIGETADEMQARIERCQLGLFGYGDPKSIVKPASKLLPSLEAAIREGLILGRLPCSEAWAIASRLGISKMTVSNAAEKLGVRISQCQLGAF